MKSPLKTLLAAAAFGLTAFTPLAFAQDSGSPPPPPPSGTPDSTQEAPPPPRRRGGDALRMVLSKVSNLTDAEKAQLRTIGQNARSQLEALRDDDSMSREDKRAKMQEITKATLAQARAVLTADQQAQFDAAVAALPHRGRGGAAPDAAPPPPPPSN